jgi:predicted transcriptional regulator
MDYTVRQRTQPEEDSIMSAKPSTITFRTGEAERQQLDTIANSMDRDRSYVINQAIANYLDVYRWQVEHIEEGLKQVERGEFAPESEWRKAFNRGQ